MDATTYEATLEEMVINNLGFVQLRGFPEVYAKNKRQFKLPTGKVCDIFSYELIDNELRCKIFELKRGEIGIAALFQVLEYGETIAKCSFGAFEKINIELYLIGSDLSVELFNLFAWGLNVKILTYEYKVDGIYFEELEPPGIFPSPLWISRQIEMISKQPDKELNAWIERLTKDGESDSIQDLQNKLK